MILKTISLTPEILHIVRDRGTEYPHTGVYNLSDIPGSYLCRQCGLALFRATDKFTSSCGWPSFDDDIKNAVTTCLDADDFRHEIICARCQAHLGHVFKGEYLTSKNTRYCVNSLSLDFIVNTAVIDTEEGIFAGGCFWGMEHYFKQLSGILKTEVGYTGGHKSHPTYQEVCTKNTGHLEAIRVIYDPKIITYEKITKYFFEIHDPTQTDGQGPDHGEQYFSAVFYYNDMQQQTALSLIQQLEKNHYKIVTQLLPVSIFWPAEDYHQAYYQKAGKHPYCHHYVSRF